MTRRRTPPVFLFVVASMTLAVVIGIAGWAVLDVLDDAHERRPAVQETAVVERGEVVAVIDGDTFDVQLPEGGVRVRIIGIDTPEIARQAGGFDECYAQSARAFLDSLLYRRTVTLQADPTQAVTDKYGRLLRHVALNGMNVALAAIEAGMGEEYTYDTPYTGQDDYVSAMTLARETGEGLWGACGSGGDSR